MSQITLVTSNQSKVRQYRHALGDIVTHHSMELDEIQSIQLEDVTKHKLQQAYNHFKSPVLIDDGGLFVAAWNGFPGALSKWLIESVGLKGILKMLEGYEDRRATFEAILGYQDKQGQQFFKGVARGSVAKQIRGQDRGFGFEPIFIPEGQDLTFAEMPIEEKLKRSHRGQAIEKFQQALASGGVKP